MRCMDEYGMNIPQIAAYTCVLECGGHMEDSNMMHVIWTDRKERYILPESRKDVKMRALTKRNVRCQKQLFVY